jgi:hypothetical protein
VSVTGARGAPVFSAAGHCFTWQMVIEAARARGDWGALQRHVVRMLARERDLATTDGLPTFTEVRLAANEFRYQHNLLSADELEEWLARRDITMDEWRAEMRRSLLEPLDRPLDAPPEAVAVERSSWVHAVCSGKLAGYARALAEEVAVHLRENPSMLMPAELTALPAERERFCAAQLSESKLAAEVRNNVIGWTRLDCRALIHRDEMVVREAALCVTQDGRELADVAVDAGAELRELSCFLEDAEPALRARLLAARPGELIGPFLSGEDHLLVAILDRTPPIPGDPAVHQRAGETIIRRALAAEVSRQVSWHEHL